MKTFSEFSLNLFFLLFGFLLGNLFPDKSIFENFFSTGIDAQENAVNSSFLRSQNVLDGMPQGFLRSEPLNFAFFSKIIPFSFPGPYQIGLFILFFSEFINWNGAFWKKRARGLSSSRPQLFILSNSFKIGLLFGIFVDAFKVGS